MSVAEYFDVEKFNSAFHAKLSSLSIVDRIEVGRFCLNRGVLITNENDSIEHRERKLRHHKKYFEMYQGLVNELGVTMSGWDGVCFKNAVYFCKLNGIKEITDINGILNKLLNRVNTSDLIKNG